MVVLSWKYFKQQTKFHSFKIISTGFAFKLTYGMLVYSRATISMPEFEVCVQNTVIDETKSQYPALSFGWIDFHFVTVN